MSLTTVKLHRVVFNQFKLKIKSYQDMFSALIKLQLIGLLFSFNSVGSMGNSQITINYYSADLVIVFTMLWGLAGAILMTTKDNRGDDFLFVTNRLSSDLSNMLLLFAASVFGAVTSLLASFLLQDIHYYFFDEKSNLVLENPSLVRTYVFGTVAVILYIYLFSAIGYFVGACVQLHKSFVFIIPLIIVGLLWFIFGSDMVVIIGKFYFFEHSFLMFLLKIIPTILIFFVLSIAMFRHWEVR